MRQRQTVLYLLVSVTVAALLARHIVTQARDSNGAPGSEARVELGRLLFWDPILSGHKDIACATCHHPDFAYADGRDLSRGTRGAGLGPGGAYRIPALPRPTRRRWAGLHWSKR